MKKIFLLIIFNLSLSIGFSQIISVPDDYTTIQGAIDASVNGDTIIVEAGTYEENIIFNGKNIVLASQFLTTNDTSFISSTIIDGGGYTAFRESVVRIINGENSDAQLIGFTIQNGNLEDKINVYGAGIRIEYSNPKISYCNIKNNITDLNGGGVGLWESNSVISNCLITENIAGASGGGFYAGICENSTVNNCVVSYNNCPQGFGSGISADGCDTIEITNCQVDNNYGGQSNLYDSIGVYLGNSGCILINNTIAHQAIGLYFDRFDGNKNAEIINTILKNESDVFFSEIYYLSYFNFYNSILDTTNIIYYDQGQIIDNLIDVVVNYNAVLSVNPVLINEESGDFALSNNSPAIGGGLSISPLPYLSIPNSDILNNPRPNPVGSNPDIGAYENILASPDNLLANQDSLALVALYNSTDGANWNNNTNWLSSEPISNWYGVAMSADNNRVSSLNLPMNNLVGTIPPNIGNLTNLNTLNFSSNQLTGSIPTEIGNLTSLQYLFFEQNQLSGSIPAELGNLTNLELLYLYQNQLSGSIPAEIGNLTKLSDLSLNYNYLSGSIPAEIGNLIQLTDLLLGDNTLTGSIPAEIGNLTNLTHLRLHTNQLTGSIPAELGNLTNLIYLYLHTNQLTGSIPAELGNLTSLGWFMLAQNQLTGTIPAELGNLTSLGWLWLYNNSLTGSIPAEIGNLINLQELLLQQNQLTGSVPEEVNNLSNLTRLILNNNDISSLPTLTHSNLEGLWVANNKLTFEDIEPNIGVPNFTYSPQDSIGIKRDTVGIVGQDISFTVNGSGDTWQWYKDGVPLANGGNISGANAETLWLSNLASSDEGKYHCEVINSNVPDLTLYSRPITLSVSTTIQTVTDVDGNEYNTIQIGTQTWMQENLKTTTYNDGTPIPNVTDNTEWLGLSTGAYSWNNNDQPTYGDTYGALYNGYAVNTGNLCPSGWHVPADEEWTTLISYLGGENVAGGKLKETGTTHWNSPNTGATNETGFTALPGGTRGTIGTFHDFGSYGGWWSATKWEDEVLSYRSMNCEVTSVHWAGYHMKVGFSVRCLKDSEATTTFALTVQDVTVDENQSLEVPISVCELTAAENIISYQFDIDFDNVVLEYTGNDIVGTLSEGGTIEVNTGVAGKLSISYMTSTAIVGTGDILKLQFNTLVTDTTELLISNAYLNSTEVTDLTAGTVIIKDVTAPTAAVTYNDTDIKCGDDLLITATFSESMLASNAVNISLSGAVTLTNAEMTRISETVYIYNYSVPKANGDVTVSLSNGTDLWSNEVVSTPTSGGSFTIIGLTLGDVDDDGKILAYDAALTLQHSVGLNPLPIIDALPWENWRDSTANVDGTAGITANDAGMILQYSAGLITDFLGSSKKSAPQAFISMEFLDNGIIFYSYGELLGLNVSVDNDIQILGEPIILGENFMSASNINDTVYRVGLCTTSPPADGEAILKIPFNKNGSVNINMIVNDAQKSMALNLSTGITDFEMNGIMIYPNPVRDNLNISGLTSETVAKIYGINGQLMLTRNLTNTVEEIIVSDLPVGLYIIKLETYKETTVKRFIIR